MLAWGDRRSQADVSSVGLAGSLAVPAFLQFTLIYALNSDAVPLVAGRADSPRALAAFAWAWGPASDDKVAVLGPSKLAAGVAFHAGDFFHVDAASLTAISPL